MNGIKKKSLQDISVPEKSVRKTEGHGNGKHWSEVGVGWIMLVVCFEKLPESE